MVFINKRIGNIMEKKVDPKRVNHNEVIFGHLIS